VGVVAGCPSTVPDGEGGGVAAGGVAGCPSPVVAGEAAGASAAGAASVGEGGDCGDGGVCANAVAHSDEIKKEIDASKRGRNDTEAPLPSGEANFHDAAGPRWRMQADKFGDAETTPPSDHRFKPKSVLMKSVMLLTEYAPVKDRSYLYRRGVSPTQ
jgi:hypothetical protein